MKYFTFSLLMVSCLLGCEDAQNEPAPLTTEINIRLENRTGETFQSTFLRFSEQGSDAEFLNYGALGPDELTDYLVFDQAGSCGIDFFTEYVDGLGGPNFQSNCECICPLEPGFYTATLANNVLGNVVFFDVSISEDE